MLVLSRKKTETIRIGDNITITVKQLGRNHVRLAVEAPRDVPILREETYQRILAAAETGNPPLHVAEDDLDVDENRTRPEKDDGEQDDSPEEPQGCG